ADGHIDAGLPQTLDRAETAGQLQVGFGAVDDAGITLDQHREAGEGAFLTLLNGVVDLECGLVDVHLNHRVQFVGDDPDFFEVFIADRIRGMRAQGDFDAIVMGQVVEKLDADVQGFVAIARARNREVQHRHGYLRAHPAVVHALAGDLGEKVHVREARNAALKLLGNGQRVLPFEETWHPYTSAEGVAEAIRTMVVRGAPAIGISAAYGIVLAVIDRLAEGDNWQMALEEDFELLANSRPTADHEDPRKIMEAEAVAIHLSDREANLTMAQLGAELIRKHQGNLQTVLTHCNTGALATGGFGTALGVIRAAHLEGMIERVYADETRPWLQGSRLTAWELVNEGIPVTLNAD
nr:methylthioribose-1-phosphate isomerase [Tanacetum cinerariifolium]